ncbi:MAG: ATP-binding protein, partial [Ktedonobacteraceae bacterium]
LELADLRAVRSLNSAIDPLDRILAIDPTNEAAVQRLIKLLAQLDRRGEALRVYKRLAAILQQEYHIAPLPETRSLYDAVRLGVQERKRDTVVPANRDSAAATGQDDYKDAAPALLIGRTHQSPLVGRDQELSLLQGLLLATEHTTKFKLPSQKKVPALPLDTRRNPQSVLLMGEVGIGKTRLAEEMAREARRRGWAVAWSRVYPQEVSIPYRLWTEVMRKAMDQVTWQRQEVSKRPLIYQPLTALLPELDSLLTQVALPSSQSLEQEQLRLWEATCELLTVISEGSPLLIVLDDVQWADSSSCELFAYLARRLYSLPIVIVGTCRENELGSSHSLRLLLTDLQREHAVETVQLQPLSDEQIGAIVSHVPHLSEPAVQYIQTRAAGNPFFAEELARTVGSSSTGGPFITSNHLEDTLPALPNTIAAALNLRLSRLSSACQRLLSKAAVLGSSFEFHLISAMEASTPGSNEDTVLDLVEEAMQSGMLTEEGAGTRITYQFWHPLLVTHLYENISAARRSSFHRRAAEILREVYQGREEEGAAPITHHLVKGGAPSQLVAHYAELAGNRAYALSAYPDGERYYRLAVEHLERSARPSTDANTDEQAHLAYLLEFLGECTRLQGKYEEARHIYEQALEISKQQQPFPSSAVAQIEITSATQLFPVSPPSWQLDSVSAEIKGRQEAQIRAMLWCEVGYTWYDVGNNKQALQCYKQGERVLQNAHITEGPAWATIRLQQSYVSWREGNYEKARHNAQEALQLFERALAQQEQGSQRLSHSTRIRRILAGDPVELGRTHALLGLIANGAGQSTEATNRWKSALATFEQYDRQREIAVVCCNLGDVHLRRAEYNQAQAFLRRSLGIAERIGELPLVCVVFGNMGVQALRTGDLAEAENRFKQG